MTPPQYKTSTSEPAGSPLPYDSSLVKATNIAGGVTHPKVAGDTVQDTIFILENSESSLSEIDTENLHTRGKWSRLRRCVDDSMFEVLTPSSLQQS
jgi:hypothetical protein